MKKLFMILAGSVLLTTSAFAGVHNQSGGNRDRLSPKSCWRSTCTNHESLSSIQNSHTHMLKAKNVTQLDLEERRRSERSSRGSFFSR